MPPTTLRRPAARQPDPPALAAALAYHRLGWSVVPLCPPDHRRCTASHVEHCGNPGKVPLILWAPFQKRPAPASTVRTWWQTWPNANVGVATGPASRLVGIDVDGEPGEDLLNQWAGGEELPPTLRFLTGRPGSYRLLYRTPAGHPCPQWPMDTPDGATALTILGEGGQTVMPPSVHASGAHYTWGQGYGPGEFELADAPAWMLARLAARAADVTSGRVRPSTAHTGDGGIIPRGGRDNALTAMAGAVRRFGCTEEEIRSLLLAVNNRCDPPMPLADLNRITRSVGRYTPAEVPGVTTLIERTTRAAGAVLVEMSDVETTRLEWVWPQWLPAGCLACLDGDGGVGKSTVALDLCARISRGAAMPDGSRPDAWEGPQNVLVIACEDSLEKTIRPRMDAAGADVARVKYLEEVVDQGTGSPRMIELPRDIPVLEKVVAEHRIRLVVIDPILAFMGGEGDYSRDQDVRQTIGPLKRIANEYGCTFLYIRHWNKGSQGQKASYRGGGSLAWVNVARAAFCCGRNPDDPDLGEFHWVKSNLAPRQQGWVYRTVMVGPGVTRIEWVGRSSHDADAVAGTAGAAGPREPGSRPGSVDEAQAAAAWLRLRLSAGPAPATETREEMRAAGFTPWQVRSAQQTLGVVARREGNAGRAPRYVWELPAAPAGGRRPRPNPGAHR